jgi:hypothetical protein
MDGQNPNNKKVPKHGLRLVKGQVTDRDYTENDQSSATKKAKKNPLIVQLSALADAVDADVKMLLNL